MTSDKLWRVRVSHWSTLTENHWSWRAYQKYSAKALKGLSPVDSSLPLTAPGVGVEPDFEDRSCIWRSMGLVYKGVVRPNWLLDHTSSLLATEKFVDCVEARLPFNMNLFTEQHGRRPRLVSTFDFKVFSFAIVVAIIILASSVCAANPMFLDSVARKPVSDVTIRVGIAETGRKYLYSSAVAGSCSGKCFLREHDAELECANMETLCEVEDCTTATECITAKRHSRNRSRNRRNRKNNRNPKKVACETGYSCREKSLVLTTCLGPDGFLSAVKVDESWYLVTRYPQWFSQCVMNGKIPGSLESLSEQRQAIIDECTPISEENIPKFDGASCSFPSTIASDLEATGLCSKLSAINPFIFSPAGFECQEEFFQ